VPGPEFRSYDLTTTELRTTHICERIPSFDTILKVMTALGLKLHAEAI
jgi:DNA-binding phage protein